MTKWANARKHALWYEVDGEWVLAVEKRGPSDFVSAVVHNKTLRVPFSNVHTTMEEAQHYLRQIVKTVKEYG